MSLPLDTERARLGETDRGKPTLFERLKKSVVRRRHSLPDSPTTTAAMERKRTAPDPKKELPSSTFANIRQSSPDSTPPTASSIHDAPHAQDVVSPVSSPALSLRQGAPSLSPDDLQLTDSDGQLMTPYRSRPTRRATEPAVRIGGRGEAITAWPWNRGGVEHSSSSGGQPVDVVTADVLDDDDGDDCFSFIPFDDDACLSDTVASEKLSRQKKKTRKHSDSTMSTGEHTRAATLTLHTHEHPVELAPPAVYSVVRHHLSLSIDDFAATPLRWSPVDTDAATASAEAAAALAVAEAVIATHAVDPATGCLPSPPRLPAHSHADDPVPTTPHPLQPQITVRHPKEQSVSAPQARESPPHSLIPTRRRLFPAENGRDPPANDHDQCTSTSHMARAHVASMCVPGSEPPGRHPDRRRTPGSPAWRPSSRTVASPVATAFTVSSQYHLPPSLRHHSTPSASPSSSVFASPSRAVTAARQTEAEQLSTQALALERRAQQILEEIAIVRRAQHRLGAAPPRHVSFQTPEWK